MTFDVSRFVSFDLETYLIELGLLAPRIVCGSGAVARVEGDRAVVAGGKLWDASHAFALGVEILDSDIMVGANVAFDLGCLAAANPDVLPLIFKAYEERRVYDIQIAQALHAIAEGHLNLDPRTMEPLKAWDAETGKYKSARYSLNVCAELVLDRTDAKRNDYWRKRYAILERLPLEEWPADARQYPVDDAVNTLEVALAQVQGGGAGCTPGPHRNLGDLSNQVETAFALHLGAMWGLRTDPERVEALRRRTEEAHASFVQKFAKLGFIKPDGKVDKNAVKRAVVRAYGHAPDEPCPAPGCIKGKVISPTSGNPINCRDCSGTGLDVSGVPRTAGDGVAADRDTLMESGDEHLVALGENEVEKIRDTYIPFLEDGLFRPITLKPNVLVESGRTSYSGVIQLLPQKGGVRECVRARRGYVFCSVDYSALELCTFSQVCLWILGRSHMAETINASGNPGALHTAFAARLVNKTPEEMTALIKAADEMAKSIRQVAKFCNFALLGGMGAAKFCLLARKKSAGSTTLPDGSKMPGIRFCILLGGESRCGEHRVTEFKGRPIPPVCRDCLKIADEILRPSWFEQWDEVPGYFSWVNGRVEAGGEMPCFGTDRVRGGCDFTSAANNSFQALAADGAKHALRKLVRECYLGKTPEGEPSPLEGTRPIIFVHDEVFAEMPESVAHEAGPRMAKVMVDAMKEYVPDVCIVGEPALARYWDKGMETVHDDSGRLVVWERAA